MNLVFPVCLIWSEVIKHSLVIKQQCILPLSVAQWGVWVPQVEIAYREIA